MNKDNRRDSKTPLEYYEKAILQLTETQEELQKELKSIHEIKLIHEDLKVQLQEAKGEIKILKEKLVFQESQENILEQDETKIKRIETNTNYLHEEIEGLKHEVDRIKNSGKNNNYLYGEVEKLKGALDIKQKQLDKAQKEINLVSTQTSELSTKLNKIIQNENTSRTLPYRKLERYLITKQWKKADKETFVKIQELVGKVGYSRLSEEDLSRLSCNELAFIDQLWLKYSQGHFGLSVQNKIYQSIGGNRNIDREIWKRFGKKLGWYVNHKWIWYGDVNFLRDAPSGHLPARVWDAYDKGGVGSFNQLMARLINCDL